MSEKVDAAYSNFESALDDLYQEVLRVSNLPQETLTADRWDTDAPMDDIGEAFVRTCCAFGHFRAVFEEERK